MALEIHNYKKDYNELIIASLIIILVVLIQNLDIVSNLYVPSSMHCKLHVCNIIYYCINYVVIGFNVHDNYYCCRNILAVVVIFSAYYYSCILNWIDLFWRIYVQCNYWGGWGDYCRRSYVCYLV